MARRYFTVAEVERLIPTLEKTFVRVLQLRAGMRGHEAALERAGVELSTEVLGKEDPRDSVPVRQAKARFRAYYEVLTVELSEVAALGGEVKDLDSGLVDFPGKRGSEDILLCWKLGEKKIAYWHSVEDGFAGR